MIFSVQRFLEDYFERRGLTDVDQYAIRIANVFERGGAKATPNTFLRDLRRVRTVFYRRNDQLTRRTFEAALATTLENRFKKKRTDRLVENFESALSPARARLQGKRRSIEALLCEFKRAVEARGVDAFWDSRKRHSLRSKPEKIAQALLAVFAKGTLGNDAIVLREIASGIGFVDVGISFGSALHLIELKILKSGRLVGASQLAAYMKTERRRNGWLVVIDGRKTRNGTALPPKITTSAGTITTVIVEINPVPPNVA